MGKDEAQRLAHVRFHTGRIYWWSRRASATTVTHAFRAILGSNGMGPRAWTAGAP